ncbi:MAG: Nif3-like dinuclear metal center hexameric protein [Saprospiraceae bacterium]|nr:Nif3-like dinuclear metal center hexameric protein [Saprospiraceae bacterium]
MATKINDLLLILNAFAPYPLQEEYDNSGLLTGDRESEVKRVLVCLDCTEEVISEAISLGCNVVIAHHPIIFKGLKSLTGKNYVEKTVILAIRHEIAIISCHTNLDNVLMGVNAKIAEKLGLQHTRILSPKENTLKKLTFFVPDSHLEVVSDAIHQAGAGQIGNYKDCAFMVEGTGSFIPNGAASPYSGAANVKSFEKEVRVEVILPVSSESSVLKALKHSHPYEEIAYYLHTLDNVNQEIGAGMVGELPDEMPVESFLDFLKVRMELKVIRHTKLVRNMVKKVALCGGSGSFLTSKALLAGADVFISADFKYHDFFDAEDKIIIADIGHYESEKYTIELLFDLISNNFSNFALHYSTRNTNPVNYY